MTAKCQRTKKKISLFGEKSGIMRVKSEIKHV